MEICEFINTIDDGIYKDARLGDIAICCIEGHVLSGKIDLISWRGVNLVRSDYSCVFVKWINVIKIRPIEGVLFKCK